VESWNTDSVTLHFAVSDTGIGIPPDKLSVIFEAFSQADGSITRKYGGTGLGLTISTRLVEMMHGKLTAESTPGEGSVFHFTAALGLGKTDYNHERKETPDPVLEGKEVLIVDDNDTVRRVLRNMLLYWKMKPTIVESGEQAIALMQEKHVFSYILLDTQMPDMDGFSVATFIRTMPTTLSKCSIIMMLSSTAQRGTLEQHADLPISVYLNKPIGQGELLEALLKPYEKKVVKEAAVSAFSSQNSASSKPSVVKKNGNPLRIFNLLIFRRQDLISRR
jgi:CheY-like chemotaxis protein